MERKKKKRKEEREGRRKRGEGEQIGERVVRTPTARKETTDTYIDTYSIHPYISRRGSEMEVEVDEKDLKAAGAEMILDGRLGLRIYSREIESCKRSILDSRNLQQWEEKLHTSHFPEMVFGNSCLFLKHVKSGIKIHFNAFDALTGWMQEALPPVEAPAAAKWKFISKYFQQVIIHSQHLTVDLLGEGKFLKQTCCEEIWCKKGFEGSNCRPRKAVFFLISFYYYIVLFYYFIVF